MSTWLQVTIGLLLMGGGVLLLSCMARLIGKPPTQDEIFAQAFATMATGMVGGTCFLLGLELLIPLLGQMLWAIPGWCWVYAAIGWTVSAVIAIGLKFGTWTWRMDKNDWQNFCYYRSGKKTEPFYFLVRGHVWWAGIRGGPLTVIQVLRYSKRPLYQTGEPYPGSVRWMWPTKKNWKKAYRIGLITTIAGSDPS